MSACLVVALAGCGGNAPEYPSRSMPAGMAEDPDQVAIGHQLFLEHCADCHGKVSEGRSGRADAFQPPAPDFTESRYRDADPAYLYWRIETGKTVEPYRSRGSVMPAWGMHFSERQIWQLVAYLIERSH